MGLVFRLGWPIGVTGLLESGAVFRRVGLMMGWIGTVELAAHGIAMEIAALAFMVHLGLSNAATVRTGHAEGAGDIRGAARRGQGGDCDVCSLRAGHGGAVPGLSAARSLALFLDMAKPDSARIVAYGTVLLALAALFQLGDAMQVMALGLLRGIRDTRVPMWAAAFSYWVIGIPVSYVLGFGFDLGGVGLWLGLCRRVGCGIRHVDVAVLASCTAGSVKRRR